MANVKIYVKDPCPYCVRAIRLLDELNIAYDEIDLTDKEDEIQKLKNETGWRTVPIIMIKGKLIGGYTDLKALVDEDKLMELVK